MHKPAYVAMNKVNAAQKKMRSIIGSSSSIYRPKEKPKVAPCWQMFVENISNIYEMHTFIQNW
jgi:hypothetical protein